MPKFGLSTTKQCPHPSIQADRVVRFAFPNDEDFPSQFLQCSLGPAIARDILRKLFLPEVNSRLWHISESASRMPVPKASVNKNYSPMFGQHDVRFARQISPMQAKAVAQAMEAFANRDFGVGVGSPYPAHIGAALLRCDSVQTWAPEIVEQGASRHGSQGRVSPAGTIYCRGPLSCS